MVGIAIMGFLEPRTVLGACSSTAQQSVSVYQFIPWPHLEAYTDYRDLYLRCLVSPYLSGNGPYHLGTIVYNYPPLFLYLIAGFAAIWNIVWMAAVPLITFDILTVIPVYLISKEFMFCGNERLVFFASLFWVANPLNLFYNDLMWLNTAPTAFFLILAIYFFLKKDWVFSSVALAVSTGFKQISIILFPVLLILLWKATGFSKKLLAFASSYILLLVLISTPYIFNDSQNYFWSLNFPIFGIPKGVTTSPPTFGPSLSDPIRITTFLGFLSSSLSGVVSVTYQYLDYALAAAFLIFIVYLISGSLFYPEVIANSSDTEIQDRKTHKTIGKNAFIRKLRITLKTIGKIAYIRKLRIKRTFSANEILVFSLTIFLVFFSLFGRGVYKYYFASITPLAIPFFRSKLGVALFEIISVVLFLAPREVTPWIAVLLLTMVPTLLFQESFTQKAQQAN